MRTLLLVGDDRTSPEMGRVEALFSPDRYVYVWDTLDSIYEGQKHGDELIVLQHGALRDHELDFVDKAIELGLPVLEYK